MTDAVVCSLEYHIHGYSDYHGRVPERRPNRLVWLCLLSLPGRFPSFLGQGLQVLPAEDSLPDMHCHL